MQQVKIASQLLVPVCFLVLGINISATKGVSPDMQGRFSLLYFEANYLVAEQACQGLGFDGLAILSTPEEFNYVFQLSADVRRESLGGLWLALRLDELSARPLWTDGSFIASDAPWINNSDISRTCGRLHRTGSLGLFPCHSLRYAVCGKHDKALREAEGSTYLSTVLNNVTSILTESKVESYLGCALLCSRENLCRAAYFDLVRKSCKILGPGSFSVSDFQSDPDSTTFVRKSFIVT
ncbi:hypothetical protein PoB_004490200 [Plakobranchus ocellatus]|uniref:C-type lectin domain-containing protein n=1 Tax=Plakobranchus ocellatus TaxID=259542 RepID=A0AAV4BG80_9GAST|nr:hypothetical protein PoB_004490200 [Plakobranchus ocellatus]